ncbi:MAG: glycosyltransferase family 4 protein [Methylovirgula sp.]
MTDEAPRSGRAFLLSPVVPDARGNGLARRAWRWVAELAADHALEILVVSTYPQPPPDRPLPARMQIVLCGSPPIHPRKLADWIDPDAPVVKSISSLSGPVPDRIVVFRLYLHDVAALLPQAWRVRMELDCDDWESATRLSLAGLALRHGRIRTALRRLLEAARYARLEREVFGAYKTVHVSAAEDIPRLRRLTGHRALDVCANLIAPEPGLMPRPPAPGNKTLLFVGTLTYPPNEDAMLWFGAAILPRLRRLVPQVRVVAAGRADEHLQRCMASDGIEYVHAPAELRQIYADCAVVIAPLRGGGGAKIKVLEAWLYARPLVATSHVARGFEARAGEHFLVADNARDFAQACAQLLDDPGLAARLAREGNELVRSRYLINGPEKSDWENGLA